MIKKIGDQIKELEKIVNSENSVSQQFQTTSTITLITIVSKMSSYLIKSDLDQ